MTRILMLLLICATASATLLAQPFRIKGSSFLLNGKPLKIKGTCNHQDFAGVGVALPDRIHAYKIEKLKAMGIILTSFSWIA